MSKFYTISPIGVPPDPNIFPTFVTEFERQGHSFVDRVEDADICLFDFHSGLFNYNWEVVGSVIARKLPVVCFDSFDHWSGNGEIGENVYDFNKLPLEKHWAKALHLFIQQDLLKVVFMRKMSKAISYPPYIYPLELFQFPDCDFPPTTKEELFSRPYDFFLIANKSTPRNKLCEGLSKHFKCDFLLGHPRIPHDLWLARARHSKFFIECGGGGSSQGGFNSERAYQLITISPMTRCYSEQLILNDFIDGEDCLIVGDCLGNVSETDIDKIKLVLSDKDKLFDLYLRGIDRMHKYFNQTYRAAYILKIMYTHGIS